MVQCLTELQGIHQGMAVSVSMVVFVETFAGKRECSDLAPPVTLCVIGSEPDICKITAHAHEKRTPEYICGF